ncbi:hypothetical protein Patl1_13392 [Pistacia atlantica]|uniref:Uncharacterized protein n=1 Tax=Pistacia atlantica TaxID=434234 RepID=A0ACC1ASJ6_9ROSI|nr:hypothetical protein Patl1_13392 [Pistacia atlantica]
MNGAGFIAMYATLASRDVDCCLIPESPFYLEGEGGLFEYIEKRVKEDGHMVIVIAEGAGQDLVSESTSSMSQQDASGNKALQDVGLWISQKIKDHFSKQKKMVINLKYIDPTYMIRAIRSNASDNVYCTLLAQSAVHGAMAGYTGYTSGLVNGRQTYIPFYRINEKQNKVVITDRMWARLLSSTNQPSFLSLKDVIEDKKEEVPQTQLLEDEISSDENLEVNKEIQLLIGSSLEVSHVMREEGKSNILDQGKKMGIRFILMVNKQGQTRLAQYYEWLTLEERRALEGEIVRKCLARTEQQCSFVEHRNYKIVYRRYASLFFLVGVDNDENELAILEFIHLLVETMDRHFGNVCELDIMFHLEKAHFMLEEMVMSGCIVETSKSNILSPIQLMDKSS